MLHPTHGIGLITAFQPLHLPLAQMQQAGGFAYAQPPACRIFNHLHPLKLFLTHRHHPWRVTESPCSYGVTLSWSIYTQGLPPSPSHPPWCSLIRDATILRRTPCVVANSSFALHPAWEQLGSHPKPSSLFSQTPRSPSNLPLPTPSLSVALASRPVASPWAPAPSAPDITRTKPRSGSKDFPIFCSMDTTAACASSMPPTPTEAIPTSLKPLSTYSVTR